MALIGHGTVSDLSPLCAQKQTCIQRGSPDHISTTHRGNCFRLRCVSISAGPGYAKAQPLLLLNSIQIIDNGEQAGSCDGI